MDGSLHQHLRSASSAVDPTRAPAGPRADRARKRASWGQVSPGQDPLATARSPDGPPSGPLLPASADDPFWAGPARLPSYASMDSPPSMRPRPLPPMPISRLASVASAASLISRDTDPGSTRSDDEAELTQHMSWASGADADPEVVSPNPVRRRKSARYTQSPLAKPGARLQSLSRNMRRISVRVVNFAGRNVEDHVRLDEDEYEKVDTADADDQSVKRPDALNPPHARPLRGRTLGFLSSTNPIRLAMYRLFVYS